MGEQETINEGQIIETMLREPAFQKVLKSIRDMNYEQFKAAKTDDLRRDAWAESQVLEKLEQEMILTVSRGTVAVKERDRASGQLRKR